jgi:phosphomannomutase / phosphoglucomutase
VHYYLTLEIFMSIFRAYDIRGIVGHELTAESVYAIGRAIGSEAQARHCHSVIVGRDGRLSGPALKNALTQGLCAVGCQVIDIGLVPTPLLYYATYALNTGSGVMLTGSHNPPQYNGLKIMLGGTTLFGQDIQELKARIASEDYYEPETPGTVRTQELSNAYIRRISDDVHLQRPLKVVVDCGNGAAGEVAPRLLRALGCEVIELFCEIDGHFPHHHPDPSQPHNLRDLIAAVAHHHADLGVAFDGDGDRLGVVDGAGNIIWPDRQMMLFARDILARHHGGMIIYDVKCSRHLDSTIRAAGGTPLMWKTGHSFMKSKLKQTGALLAGEMSGHIFFQERWYGFDDALYSAARLLEILARDTRSCTEIFAELPNAVSTPELQVPMQEGAHFEFMQRFKAQAHFPQAHINDIDGLRVDFSDAWGLVRPSNTTPCLVLRFEADTEDALHRVQEQFRRQMLALDPSLTLPF